MVAPVGAACGASVVNGPLQETAPPRGVELELQRPDGSFLDVDEYRDRPMLLFLFATFDTVSQAAVRPLNRFAVDHPEVYVVGVALGPTAEDLVPAWAEVTEARFEVVFDPHDVVAEGASDLGEVPAVPAYFLLDSRGVARTSHVGPASRRRLDEMLAELPPATATPRHREPPPLLGQPAARRQRAQH